VCWYDAPLSNNQLLPKGVFYFRDKKHPKATNETGGNKNESNVKRRL